jgi:heme exporter protein D
VSEILAMGGYGGYVWPAYGVAALVMVGLLIWSLRARKAAEAALAQLEETRRGP